jgi:hypothetical protein
MSRLSHSLAIALWVVGTCWALAILGYLLGVSSEWTVPLVTLGSLTGLAKWHLRKRE